MQSCLEHLPEQCSGVKPYDGSLSELLDAGTVGDPMEASMGDINCMEDMEERLNLDTK